MTPNAAPLSLGDGWSVLPGPALGPPDGSATLAGAAERPGLLIEDDELLLGFLTAAFRARGQKVLAAGTGELGLRLARRHAPAFVVLDIGLPGRDGWQVLRSLRRCDKTAATPIVLLTGRQVVTDMFDAYALGADDYFVKPARPDDILARCHDLTRWRQ